jgi:hypothetical protein
LEPRVVKPPFPLLFEVAYHVFELIGALLDYFRNLLVHLQQIVQVDIRSFEKCPKL